MFNTPSEDNTGCAHIIEHTVLCGSKRYPVKDPFSQVLRGTDGGTLTKTGGTSSDGTVEITRDIDGDVISSSGDASVTYSSDSGFSYELAVSKGDDGSGNLTVTLTAPYAMSDTEALVRLEHIARSFVKDTFDENTAIGEGYSTAHATVTGAGDGKTFTMVLKP
jgi:hypothetical protein